MSSATRTAVVTGAGRGIGAAIARCLAKAGVKVAVAARSARELARTVEAIEAAGGAAVAVAADVTSPTEIERLVVEVRARLGQVDILVNNAGIAESAPLARTDDDLWDRHLATNLTAPFWLCRSFGPEMARRKWGRIVNVASIGAERGTPYTAAYSASKAGLVGLTRALAAELGPSGVTVNAVCPGWTDTTMTNQAVERIAARTGRSPEAARAELLARAGQRRFVLPDEVASVVAYLVSAEGDAVNGQAWTVDAGG